MSDGDTGQVEEDEFGPDLLCDPSFVPCRAEGCSRRDLHAEHEIVVGRGHRGPRKLDRCPRCQTPVVVTQTRSNRTTGVRHEIRAVCSSCDWTFTNSHNRTKT